MINSAISQFREAVPGIFGGAITYFGQPLREAVLPGIFGGAITYFGQPWRPFMATSVVHGALFSMTVSIVSKLASQVFSKIGIHGKINIALSYSVGAGLALLGSLGVAYVGLTTSAVTPAGILLLTLTAAKASDLGYTLGAAVALVGMVGVIYVGLTTYPVITGILLVTLTAATAAIIFRNYMIPASS